MQNQASHLQSNYEAQQYIEQTIAKLLQHCALQKEATFNRFQNQRNRADKRLRELVFEVAG